MNCEMTAFDLFFPTTANIDFAILHSVPISNHEMVGQSVFHVTLFPVIAVDVLSTAQGHTAVVNNDVLPLAGFDRDAVEIAFYRGRKNRVAGGGRRSWGDGIYG